jgi:hypothetical protein
MLGSVERGLGNGQLVSRSANRSTTEHGISRISISWDVEMEGQVMNWTDIKQSGSAHYRNGDTQPIDLLRDVQPHQSLTCLGIKALSDCIKYAFRMITKGINESDCDKIIHYATIAKWYVRDVDDRGT